MADFAIAWLDQREALDQAARNPLLLEQLLHWRAGRKKLNIMVLGTGTGSNFRFLAPRLGGRQEWLLLDKDLRLLAGLPPRLQGWALALNLEVRYQESAVCVRGAQTDYYVKYRLLDLAAGLSSLDLQGVDLVTASALLDLVSRNWCETLAVSCRKAGAAVFITLSYDGKVHWHPEDPDDEQIRHWVNQHQLTDKGFGPALGLHATHYLADLLKCLDYRVYLGRGDWRLGISDGEVQGVLAKGFTQAAKAIVPDSAIRVDAWLERRIKMLARSTLTVGHLDLFAKLSAANNRTGYPHPS